MAFKSELLPTPDWPERAVVPRGEDLAEAGDASVVGDRGGDGFVAELVVEAEDPLVVGQVDQVGLVQDDDGADAAFFGGDQVAVDEGGLQGGLFEGGDDQDLVDIGDQDVFAAAVATGDGAVAAVDFFDHALVVATGAEPDDVADGDDVSAVDGEGFQDSTDAAAVGVAVVGQDHAIEAVDFDDAALRGIRRGRRRARSRGGRRRFRPGRRRRVPRR